MEWQTYIAVPVAVGCACWVGWRLLRPFVKQENHEGASTPADDDSRLIQIAKVDRN